VLTSVAIFAMGNACGVCAQKEEPDAKVSVQDQRKQISQRLGLLIGRLETNVRHLSAAKKDMDENALHGMDRLEAAYNERMGRALKTIERSVDDLDACMIKS